MYKYIYIYIHTYIHIYIYTHTHTYENGRRYGRLQGGGTRKHAAPTASGLREIVYFIKKKMCTLYNMYNRN